MRALVQRVSQAKVTVEGTPVASIDRGLLIFLGIKKNDGEGDLDYIVNKILKLRIFEDEDEKMNLSIKDIGGELLIVSQFTLYGDARKGNRPSFFEAASFEEGKALYLKALDHFKGNGLKVEEGIYGADMKVSLINDGPVTIQLDSERTY